MPGSFRIGKIAGIDIDINVSWIIILPPVGFPSCIPGGQPPPIGS